jgi:murein DD-endopeptidase MepM/ murein hydrolase activator NlpD
MIVKLPILCSTTLMLSFLAGCATQIIPPSGRRPQGIFHVVKSGENLFRIGKAYDVSVKELARLNQLRDPDQIRVGQRIFVPAAGRQLPVELITPTEVKVVLPSIPDSGEFAHEGFIWPVHGPINSQFGTRGTSVHDGIDIAASEGTPIRAAGTGYVIYSDQLRGYGKLIIMRHAGGFISVYAHNEVNLVSEGQTVTRGDIIAKVGITGRVTGPHLHFELRKDNIAQDPLLHLPRLFHEP